MEYIPVKMIKKDIDTFPVHKLPSGYSCRKYQDDDKEIWAKIETSVAEFDNTEKALNYFENEFGNHISQMERRCIFLENNKGKELGTATAWYNNSFKGKCWGRLHWVAIHPDYQGRGLGKSLIYEAVKLLNNYHDRAYLTTQTTSFIAIKIYLDFGFEPYIENEEEKKGWELLRAKLNHPVLSNL